MKFLEHLGDPTVLLTFAITFLVPFIIFSLWRGLKERKILELQKKWWRENVIYHIYPRSFQDSSGDGNGDLRGILKRLDYFEFLGIKILYLSPIFKSPMVDNGYDVSDFRDINPMFGDLNDFDELLSAVHSHGMKLILDFVPNHTSDQHLWFLESRSSKNSPKRDWYIWRDPNPDGGPPNNWVSVFGGSAWTYDQTTKQYYLHQFCSEQPDLNFRNKEVCRAMEEVLVFWLEKGVDGFRVDAVSHLVEDHRFQDEPVTGGYDSSRPCYDHMDHIYTKNVDANHKIVQSWRRILDKYSHNSYRILFGEIMADLPIVMEYYGRRCKEFDFPFNFGLLELNKTTTAKDVSKVISEYLGALPKGKWPNWLLGNHDVSRTGSKVGEEFCRAMNVLLLTLPGTAITYYGEEIGMTDALLLANSLKDLRDPQRSPMQWSDEKNAGFSPSQKTWLPVTTNFNTVNVETQKNDPTSILHLYRELLKLRSTSEAFKGVNFRTIHADSSILAYTRYAGQVKFLVVINFGRKLWRGKLTGISGSGVVLIDSEMKKNKMTVCFNDVTLNQGQAFVLHICYWSC